MPASLLNTQLLVLLVGLAAILVWRRASSRNPPLPPSPPQHFLLGNLKDFPKEREWLGYAKLSQQCNSDIVSLSALGKHVIILNSHRAAWDLLEKRAIYANRPWIPMICDPLLMNLGGIITFSSYGLRWRQLRKAIHLDMQESVVPKHWPSQQTEARRLMARLLAHGDKSLLLDAQHWAAGFILSGTYGYNLPADVSTDPALANMQELLDMVPRGTSASKFLVNMFPSLRYVPEWMPGASFQTFARRARELQTLTSGHLFDRVKQEMANGVPQASYVSRMLSEIDPLDKQDLTNTKVKDPSYYEDLVRLNAGAMFGAGYDTTVSTLLSFFVVMQLHPEVQSRAREEVLSTLHPQDAFPDPADIVKLPYLQNVLSEILRWIPALPLGIPHSATEEDEYRGYRIPARSVIIPNLWAISRDESVYTDPETFNPDRFLDPNVPRDAPFGFGRRRCPGMHVANSNLLIVFAYILITFNITKAVDEDGNVIEPRVAMRKDVNSRPASLRCGLELRDPRLLTELRDE